jgi:putative transposase
MKGKRFTQEQIFSILKEHETGAKVPDLVRKHSVSEQSIYRWKSKYGGMEVSEAKRLRELEQENSRLKKLLAEAELDKAMHRELTGRSKRLPLVTKLHCILLPMVAVR